MKPRATPFERFKRRLHGALPRDFTGLSTPCVPGLVTVVLPVFNGAAYIHESIESVLGQSRGALELIVVDDGSVDATPWIVDRYRGDARLRVIRTRNYGLPAALNRGFASARGEYFTWTSADNRMLGPMLERLVEFLEANRDVEMVYADEEIIDHGGAVARNREFWAACQRPPGSGRVALPHDPAWLNYVHNNYIGGCFLYRAWAAKICGAYDEDCFGYEDYDYWMRMNALFRVRHRGIVEPLYQYRIHDGTLTARQRELRIVERATERVHGDRERRRFLLGPFDITFAGRHEWFPPMAAAYRRDGQNVFEAREMDANAMFLYRETRAHSKAVLITRGGYPAALAETGQRIFHVEMDGPVARLPGFSLTSRAPEALVYPLLAAANASLWRRQERPEVAEIAGAELGGR